MFILNFNLIRAPSRQSAVVLNIVSVISTINIIMIRELAISNHIHCCIHTNHETTVCVTANTRVGY